VACMPQMGLHWPEIINSVVENLTSPQEEVENGARSSHQQTKAQVSKSGSYLETALEDSTVQD